MMTLRQFSSIPESIPSTTSWYLSDLGEARGRQELFTKQSPQKLKVLREHAIIESAVSSNRIEGIEIELKRVGTIIFGKPLLRDLRQKMVPATPQRQFSFVPPGLWRGIISNDSPPMNGWAIVGGP